MSAPPHTILASSLALSAAAEPLLDCSGLVTDKTHGWSFEASAAKGGETFNPLEGWNPDKGGKLVSPRIALPKANAYYRLSFTASAPVHSYEAVAFYDAKGNMVADNYDVVSQFHALVKRAFPKSDVTWLVSVRGSTGCWFYCDPENFKKYVAAYRPDCVFIGGISGWLHPDMPLNGGPAFRRSSTAATTSTRANSASRSSAASC